MLVIGIDEAGYGPLLGPLVVGGAAFRWSAPETDDPDRAAAAQERVRRALARRGVPRIGDSKRVYERGGVAALEQAVLSFLVARGASLPTALDDLLASVGVAASERRCRDWYSAEPVRFPLQVAAGDVPASAARLGASLARDELAAVGLAARVVPEDPLNRRFAAAGNKATVLFDLSSDVLSELLGLAHPGEPALVVFDRQGGRKDYLPPLQRRFPVGFVWRLGETRTESSYRLRIEGHDVLATFLVKGDAQAPQVGLASMLAKYLREVYMALWNDWFGALCPGVRPTAGYVTDGRRWLAETRAARLSAGIPDDTLIRTR